MAQDRGLHVVETFTLHEYEKVEGQARPRIKQTTFDRGEFVTDKADIELLERARDEGTIGHNSFVAVMLPETDDAPEGEKIEGHSPEPATPEHAE